MPFGPFFLNRAYVDGSVAVLELIDKEVGLTYRPKRYVSYSGHIQVFAKAKALEGRLVTTLTSNPAINRPEDWWIDVYEYLTEPSTRHGSIAQPSKKYTQEQQECIEKFHSSAQLKIAAFAGTGKTHTLIGIANSAPKQRGLYLAFNKEISNEAKRKFSPNMDCLTTHALAYQFCLSSYTKEKLSKSLNANQVAEWLSLEPVQFGDNREYSPRQVGQWILETLKAFYRSADWNLSVEHVVCSRLGWGSNDEEAKSYAQSLCRWAQEVLKAARDPGSPIPLGHDGYLKLWSMSHPKLPYDFILLDEAQDTNAAVIHALTSQKAKTVYVGDKYQQIYGFRGALNAMDKIHVEAEASLTKSFRFGQPIADVANAIVNRFGDSRRLIGNSEVKSSVNNGELGKTQIYRSNMGILSGLAAAIEDGKNPFILGGVDGLRLMIDDVERLQSGQVAIAHADFFGFKNWSDLVSFSESEEGASYQTTVRIISTYGVHELKKILSGLTPLESDANLILTTAHKSKGKEWRHVEVCDDFVTQGRLDMFAQRSYSFSNSTVEEITLLYVALTRAENSLLIPEPILEALKVSAQKLGSTESTQKLNEDHPSISPAKPKPSIQFDAPYAPKTKASPSPEELQKLQDVLNQRFGSRSKSANKK